MHSRTLALLTHLCTYTTCSYVTSDVHTQCKTFPTHAQTNRHPCTPRKTYANTHIQSLPLPPPPCLLPHIHAHTYHITHKHSHHNPKCLSSSFNTCSIHTQRCKHFTALRTIAVRTTHTEEQTHVTTGLSCVARQC